MKSISFGLAVVGLSLIAFAALATTRFVNVNSASPTAPYTNWATAAADIQSAVDAANSGDLILVTNGVYQTGGKINAGTNRVSVDSKILTIQSVNGPTVTTIKGYQVPGTTNGASSVRCVYLASGATLSGFTLTNGSTIAGGNGGGVYCQSVSSIVSNCVITGNAAVNGGGGYAGTFLNCSIIGNTAFTNGGGVFGGAVTDCVITGNSAQNGGGTYGNTPINCTVAGNMASLAGGGFYASAGGAYMYDCIVDYNTAPNGSNFYLAKLVYCCTMPSSDTGSITNAPLFVDQVHGDFHLQPGSPCINAGANSYVTGGTDLDGNPRIVGGSVDMGAYEFQAPIRYVNLNNAAPASPFTNWVTAATNIQDAIDAANAGDFVVVSNGIYQTGGRVVFGTMTNRVAVSEPVTVQSVNGAAATVIAGLPGTGGYPSSGYRCVYLTNGAALIGFTLTNGATSGSGTDLVKELSGAAVWCESVSATLSNCVLVHSYAREYGGAAYSGTLNN